MSIESAEERFERLHRVARLLAQQVIATESESERERLILRALTRAHFDGMDVAAAITTDAINRVVHGDRKPS